MADADCVAFLQWALPRLGRRWAGYRRVRRQVCRRVRRRARELGLDSLPGYRAHLERHPDEWRRLDALTNITISRFYRDRGVHAFLQSDVLPALADRARSAGSATVRAWSAGCASGEEAYTLAIMWELAAAADARLEILATDVEPAMLRRAGEARYPPAAVRALPARWRDAAFSQDGDELVLAPRFRRPVTVARHDIRSEPPAGPFDLVLCRNVAFTYFDDAGQRATLRRLARVTTPGAALVIGTHEDLPAGEPGFRPWAAQLGVFRRARQTGIAAQPRVHPHVARRRRVSGSGRVQPTIDEPGADGLRAAIVRAGVRDARVVAAFEAVPRAGFVPAALRDRAARDEPIPIPHEQVTTQPSLIARMLEALRLGGGERVLEVGTGFGFQTALLAQLAHSVWSVERWPDLATTARSNLERCGIANARVIVGDGSLGLPRQAPFDAVVVSAAFPEVPRPLAEQLAPRGRLVQPIGPGGREDVVLFTKGDRGLERTASVTAAHFVRLYGRHGYEDG